MKRIRDTGQPPRGLSPFLYQEWQRARANELPRTARRAWLRAHGVRILSTYATRRA